jgi:large-conductance mechanosensitive channel
VCNVFNKLVGPGDLISLALGAIVGAAFVALAIAARPWTDTNLLQ